MVATRGAPLPQDGNRRWWKVYNVPVEGELTGICLSPIWDGHWSHWDGVRSYRCTETDGCEGCNVGHAHRWTGYLAFYERYAREGECVAAITPGACLYLQRLVVEKGFDLRGLELRFSRRAPAKGGKPAKNAPVSVEIIRRHVLKDTRTEFDVFPSVLRMWGIHAQHCARAVREAESAADKARRTSPWEHDGAMKARLLGGITNG